MESFWIENTKNLYPSLNPLENNLSCDVCIIGAGLTGLSCGYYLCENGLKVIILEQSNVGNLTSGNTTAKITSQHGLFYDYLINSFGIEYAKKYLDSNEKSIKNIHDIIEKNNIECDFKNTDSYVFSQDINEINKIKQEYDAMKKLDFPAEYLENIPLPMDIHNAIKFPNQAQFNPRKYMYGLLKFILNNNGQVFENSKVIDVKKEQNLYSTLCNNYKVTSKHVIIATKYPFINFPGLYFLKMYQSTSYAICVEVQEQLFDGMYLSSNEPTMSFRTISDGDRQLLLIGGSDHKTGSKINLENAYNSLEDIAKKMYSNYKIINKWNTEDCISVDKVPYIGNFSTVMPNIYVATGFKKWGMTTSNIAANILTDMILKKDNKYSDIFLSTRFHPIKNFSEVKNIVKETSHSLVLNKLYKPTDSICDIPINEGKIIIINGKKVGVYKDENNNLYKVKPLCSHLGCELSFNNISKTWDCPCHGSRFDYNGKCIYGPSINDLDIL